MPDTLTLLDRAPAGFRRLAYRIASGHGVLGRAADAVRFRFTAEDIPELPPRGDTPVRLLIGPANSAGQGYLWARAIAETLPGVTAVALREIGGDTYLPSVDVRVPAAVYQRSAAWQDALESYLEQQTHVIWESGLPLLGRRYGSDVREELRRLGARGVSGALLFHGSDIRPPFDHAAQSAWSPFRQTAGPTRALAETAAANAALAADVGVPVFVSTPDLQRWLPDSVWLPVVVDPSMWRLSDAPSTPAGPPVVVHAPSRRWIKGTDRIEPMLHRLSAEGVIAYEEVVGIRHASMPALYAGADIVLDQFALGSYGVAACEAMASGRLVMGHVDDFTRSQVRRQTGLELPIQEATIDSLEAELRRAAADPAEFADARAVGPAFVEAVHDGRRSAAAAAPFLGLSA
ncbi:MAG: hypothetical protein ABIS08_01245 [Pseudolysinimonas sp.]